LDVDNVRRTDESTGEVTFFNILDEMDGGSDSLEA
jgi:hypothetical protein